MLELKRTIDLIEAIKAQTDADGLSAAIGGALWHFGFPTFCFGQLPRGAAPRVLSNCRADWMQKYLGDGYVQDDPVKAMFAVANEPFTWGEAIEPRRDDPRAMAVMEEAAAHGLTAGVGIPIRDLEGDVVMVNFGGDRKEPVTREERTALSLIALYAENRIGAVSSGLPVQPGGLTEREVECLLWAANGKTTWETSRILSISEGRVDALIKKATAKLGAVNKTQAVAIAIRMGLIG